MASLPQVEDIGVLEALAPSDQVEVARQVLADVYRSSLYHLCRDGLGYQDLTWHTHGKIVLALQAQTRRKLIVVPRGSFKSSITVVGFSIFLLLRDPNVRILIDSELYSNSATFLREIKAHLQSPHFVALFGSFEGPIWNEGEITIRQRTVPRKEASITCGGVETTKVGQHYDVIIGDDFNSPKNTATAEGRRKVIDHIRYNVSILEPGGTLAFTATRYHEEDATGFILRDLVGISVEEAFAATAQAA